MMDKMVEEFISIDIVGGMYHSVQIHIQIRLLISELKYQEW